jgi:UDP-galactopyranose mutase
MRQYDIIVVGAGFSGSVFARRMAEYGKNVLIIEKRAFFGGNMYEEQRPNCVYVHKYGPHLFQTNNQLVFNFLNRFSTWIPYTHKVLGCIDEKLVPIPFNFKSIDLLFEKDIAYRIKTDLLRKYGDNSRISVLDMLNADDSSIQKTGQFIFEKVFINYTAKQWGVPVEEVDKSTINRVPVVIGYDDNYFIDAIQYMPEKGFNDLFKNMLSHKNIHLMTNIDASSIISFDFEHDHILVGNRLFSGILFFSGAIDKFLNYRYGFLPYRSLDFHFEDFDMTCFQEAAVVNYPNNVEEFTRITEYKYFTRFSNNVLNATTISKEYPKDCHSGDVPFYPIINSKNIEIYDAYKTKLRYFKNLILCGRLAEYKYYNMDTVIERALWFADCVINKQEKFN